MARLGPEELRLDSPWRERTARPGSLTKRLLQRRGLLELTRPELYQLLKLRQLGRNQLNQLLNLLELLKLLELEVFQLLQLLRHDLQQLDNLLQRLRDGRISERGARAEAA
jgi:hypothetical protein